MFADAIAVAADGMGMGLVPPGTSEKSPGPGRQGRGRTAVEDEITERNTAQIDAEPLAEVSPERVGEHLGRRVREVMAPVGFPPGGQQAAATGMHARGDRVEVRGEAFAQGDEGPRDGRRAGFDPEHGGGAGQGGDEGFDVVRPEFGQDMTDQRDGDGGWVRVGADGQSGEAGAGPVRGVLERPRGTVMEPEVALRGGAMTFEEDPPGDAGATAPVEDVARGRRPAAPGEVVEDERPLPADALGEGGVVTRQFGVTAPVVLWSRGAGEEPGAQAIEGWPVGGGIR